MDYEKKYKELAGKIKKAYLYAQTDSTKAVLKDILPELKESEDERIRKSILSGIKYLETELGWDAIGDVDILDAYAWLERQGKKEEPQVYETEDAEIITYFENDGYKIIKPKFNIGDWITNGRYNKLIVGINSDWPFYMFKDGTSIRIKDIDKKYHLWSIADSKDGDVLATSAGAFIYNGNNGGGCCPGCYCGIDTLNNFKIGTEHHWTTKTVFPATPEQRNLLFKKMKESGYEWNTNNKELKKIEENSFESSDIVEKALREAGYEWSEDTHQLKIIEPKFKVGDFS